MTSLEEKIFANAFNQKLEFGPARLNLLCNYFGSFKKGWNAPLSKIQKAANLKDLKEFRPEIDPDKEWKILEENKIGVLLLRDLPKQLKEIADQPAILYFKGAWPVLNKQTICLGAVGTRKNTGYGKEAVIKIINGLKGYEFIIISGLAIGIDTIAHETALKNNLKTIAVLGAGLSEQVLYPPSNKKLAENIVSSENCIISEYPFKMTATLWSFPSRNRIIAGLSRGVLVIEAGQKSGALITANLALEYNRDVFGVPGSIFSEKSEGVNNLIKSGATPVTNANDILNYYGFKTKEKEENEFSETEKQILKALNQPLTKDELVRSSRQPAKELNAILTMLELKGAIKQTDSEIYKIA